MSSSLLCLYYPQQLLPGLASVQRFRQHRHEALHRPVVLLLWIAPETPPHTRQRRIKTFQLLLQKFPWVILWAPESLHIRDMLSAARSVKSKAHYLKNKLRQYTFSDVHYAHDITSDFISQSAMQAFPTASRVCFGDSLGVVYRNAYFESLYYPITLNTLLRSPVQCTLHGLARLKRSWALPPKRRLEAQYTALILPNDPGQNFIDQTTQLKIPRNNVLTLINFMRTALESLEHRLLNLLPKAYVQSTLLLLGSFSESRLCTEDQEINLYLETVATHVMRGSTLVIKPHPVARETKIKKIIKQLAVDYRVILVENSLIEIPVELMKLIVARCKILSFSYATISLSYLFEATHVEHVLTDQMIGRYFYKKKRKWLLESNQHYLEQLQKISGSIG